MESSVTNYPFISFDHPTIYEDEDQDIVQDRGERLSLTMLPHGLLMNVENDVADYDGNPDVHDCGFLFSKEEALSLAEFIKRHYGE